MTARFLGRRIIALVVAPGVSFSAVAPALAVPPNERVVAGMTMPGGGMDNGCMEAAQKSLPAKQAPGKSTGGSCSLCIACAVNIDLALAIAETFLWHRGDRLIGADVSPDGVAIAPALPPPILHA